MYGDIVPVILFLLACGEIVGLIKIGQVIGGGPIFGEILLSGVLGIVLLQIAGRTVLRHVAVEVFVGRVSLRALLRRDLSLFLAGVLLLFPGLLSDAVGLLLVARYFLTRGDERPPRPSEPDAIDVPYEVHEAPPE